MIDGGRLVVAETAGELYLVVDGHDVPLDVPGVGGGVGAVGTHVGPGPTIDTVHAGEISLQHSLSVRLKFRPPLSVLVLVLLVPVLVLLPAVPVELRDNNQVLLSVTRKRKEQNIFFN